MSKIKYKLNKTNSIKEIIEMKKNKDPKILKKGFRLHYIILPVALIIIDQLTKYFISNNLEIGEEIIVIPGIFNIQYIINKGAALGILNDMTLFLIIISIFMIIFIIFIAIKEKKSGNTIVPELIIIGGAFGNLIDRLFLSGQVRDFLEVPFFAVMNFADWFVSLGIFLFVIKILFYSKKEIINE